MNTKPYIMAVALAASAGFAAAGQNVEKKELPNAVRQTLNQHTASGEVEKITKRTNSGQTVYEITLSRANGGDTKLVIAADGSVLQQPGAHASSSVAVDPAPTVTPAAEPTAAAGAAGIVAATGTPAGNTVAVTEPADDEIIADTESRLALDEVPEGVRATIEKEARGREIADIDREMHDDRPIYEVEFREQGINQQIHIEEDGTLVRDDGAIRGTLRNLFSGTQFKDTPQVVQDVLTRELEGREIADIDKERRSGRVVYEVEVDDAEGQFQIHVAEDGTIVKDGRLAAE